MNDVAYLINLEQPFSTLSSESHNAKLSLMAGLDAPSDYWVGLALGWLESSFPMDGEVLVALRRIVATPTFPQKIRHRAQALLAKAH